MKNSLAVLLLIGPLSLGCGQVSSSNDGGGGTAGGAAGTTGASGTTGAAGTTGLAGTTGSAGTTGAAGTTGIAGTTGSAGTIGGAGRGGTTGGAGTTGSGGRGGTTGSAGRGGSTGAAGSMAGTGGGTGGTCSYGGMAYPVGTSFPSSDGCNTCSCTAGGQIVCTLRACPIDAGAPACAFDTTYRFGQTGGHVAYEDQVTLTPPASYQHSRTPINTDPPTLSCAPALPACNTATAIDVSDVMRDIADPDVQKALAMATPPLYGRDTRPSDGSVFSFERNDKRGFLVGSPCTGAAACTDIPPGITRLVETLRALDQQQLKDPTCAALR